MYTSIANKWRKHLVLQKEQRLQPYLPETDLFSETLLWKYLERHPFVILKPVRGTGGKGIIKVSKDKGRFELQHNTQKKIFSSKSHLYTRIKQLIRSKEYLIQQGIQLLGLKGRPIDLRVVLLRPADEWEYIGAMGKMAARNKIITNFCKGGSPIMVRNVLRKGLHLNHKECTKVEREMSEVGLMAAKCLTERYRGIREVGLDMAVDQEGNLWILEVNTRPMYRLFRYHSDESLSPTIKKYVRRIRKRK